jgi:hypothetical protein
MHFRLRYVLDGMSLGLDEGEGLNFPYGGDHRVVLRMFEQVVDGRKTLLCEGLSQREVKKSVQDAFERATAGTALDSTHRAFFNEVLSELHDYMLPTVKILRWRCSVMDTPISPFRDGKEAYSFDGAAWRETPRYAVSFRISFGHPQKSKISETICKEIVRLVGQGASESFERTMFREAWNLRETYPKATLVIGVAAAEIGFRHLVGKVGGRKGILTLLTKYWPQPSPIPVVGGIQIKPSPTLLSILRSGIHKRDAVVHNGAAAPDRDELRDILWGISQLLWIWDFYSGHAWALEHILESSLTK